MNAEDLYRHLLGLILMEIRDSDPSHHDIVTTKGEDPYGKRNGLIYSALGLAAGLGLRHGIGYDPDEPGWVVAYIDLPTGQTSWHLPAYEGTYDQHSTPEKYDRVTAYYDRVAVA